MANDGRTTPNGLIPKRTMPELHTYPPRTIYPNDGRTTYNNPPELYNNLIAKDLYMPELCRRRTPELSTHPNDLGRYQKTLLLTLINNINLVVI